MPPRDRETRVIELERHLPKPRAAVPPIVAAYLLGLDDDELQHFERVLDRWPDDGQDLDLTLLDAIVRTDHPTLAPECA